jgi:hypothetical protein
MRKRRLIACLVLMGMIAVPVIANAASNQVEVRHTIEVLGSYDHGCKHEGGWMKRAWRNDPDFDQGPEADPHYPGRMWDFRCKVPPTSVVTQTQTVVVTVPGGTQTVVVPGPTVTQTVTVTPSTTPSPCDDPDSNGDANSNNHNGNGEDGDGDCD